MEDRKMEDRISSDELLSLLTNSVQDIFGTMLGIEVSLKESREVKGFSAGADVTGLMYIEGSTLGMLACSMPRALGCRITSALTGVSVDDVSTSDLNDVMAEFVNMLCGRIKSQNTVLRDLKLTPPLAISGNDHMLVWKTAYPSVSLIFEEEGGSTFEVMAHM